MPLRMPLDEYAARRADRQAVVEARDRAHVRLGNAKLAIALGGLAYGFVTLGGGPRAEIIGAAALGYLILAVWHERTMRALTRAHAAVAHYDHGIARIEDRWMGTGPAGDQFRDRDHPYADDLDLFGSGSVFQLISAARTPMGEARLASWLASPAEASEVRRRQGLVAALARRIDLRERIAVVNAGERRRIAPDRLVAWAGAARTLPPMRPVAVALGVSFATALVFFLQGGSALPMGVIALVEVGVLMWIGKRANAEVEVLSAATEAAGLDLFARVIREIEREPNDDPGVAALHASLAAGESGGAPAVARRGGSLDPPDTASRAMAKLARISDWVESRHNVFARLLEIPALFTIQVAYAADAWRARYGTHLQGWVDGVGEAEALLSLAGYAFEHPADPFPDLRDRVEGEEWFDGRDLGHPLIASATAVRNSVALGGRDRVWMVSGSNMSGKSTLLRTVGVNVALALAGAPVRATALTLTPLALGTCLRHTDSLHEGRSGFYTEVLRIRHVCDLLDGPRPVLFLFDELLSGTNSRDRRTAAEGIVRMILDRTAIGMVTTHDLALTEIAAVFPGKVRNVHLRDHVEDGRMVFDYTVRDGVIDHSNALELMRMIGLDV